MTTADVRSEMGHADVRSEMAPVQLNLALTQEAVSAALPDREYLIWRDRHFTYRQLTERSRRLASYLHQRGLGVPPWRTSCVRPGRRGAAAQAAAKAAISTTLRSRGFARRS